MRQPSDAAAISILTARQQQVLRLAVDGRSAKQIAHHLHISVRTVDAHFAAMRKRTGCESLAVLTVWAAAAGIAYIPVPAESSAGPPRGRPRLLNHEKISEASRLLGMLPVAEIARELGISRGTLYSHMVTIREAREQSSISEESGSSSRPR